jgi:hypothetical protein
MIRYSTLTLQYTYIICLVISINKIRFFLLISFKSLLIVPTYSLLIVPMYSLLIVPTYSLLIVPTYRPVLILLPVSVVFPCCFPHLHLILHATVDKFLSSVTLLPVNLRVLFPHSYLATYPSVAPLSSFMFSYIINFVFIPSAEEAPQIPHSQSVFHCEV